MKDLRQYIIDIPEYSGQGGLLRCFYLYSKKYKDYMTEILNGMLSRIDIIAVDVPDFLSEIGSSMHMVDCAGIEWDPYEQPDLVDLIVDCIDPYATGGFYGSYDKITAIKKWVLNRSNHKIDTKIADCMLNFIGIDISLDSIMNQLENTKEENWESEISGEICDYDGEYITMWKIIPSSYEKFKKLHEAFDIMGMPEEDGVFWNVGISYGEENEIIDYDYDELASVIETTTSNQKNDGDEKYNKVFEALSGQKMSRSLIMSIMRTACNRKDVLF